MQMKYTFSDLQKLIQEQELYIWYDNDYWELNTHPDGADLTDEECEAGHIVDCGGGRDNVDLSTFPAGEVMYPNCYGNGLIALLAHTPNHKIKGVSVA
jgi:hypothetical protein